MKQISLCYALLLTVVSILAMAPNVSATTEGNSCRMLFMPGLSPIKWNQSPTSPSEVRIIKLYGNQILKITMKNDRVQFLDSRDREFRFESEPFSTRGTFYGRKVEYAVIWGGRGLLLRSDLDVYYGTYRDGFVRTNSINDVELAAALKTEPTGPSYGPNSWTGADKHRIILGGGIELLHQKHENSQDTRMHGYFLTGVKTPDTAVEQIRFSTADNIVMQTQSVLLGFQVASLTYPLKILATKISPDGETIFIRGIRFANTDSWNLWKRVGVYYLRRSEGYKVLRYLESAEEFPPNNYPR